ncbi:hypothetical protein PR048_032194 [Dryococelus australis]|uniref:Uncharacterized protein n=1 Tax=Dryococelus australis TaxID=614101 RepID=A0ABQ9G4C8_9NEOP|nr:hypothetical protein PR048_032194 [Dryococelus australis]
MMGSIGVTSAHIRLETGFLLVLPLAAASSATSWHGADDRAGSVVPPLGRYTRGVTSVSVLLCKNFELVSLDSSRLCKTTKLSEDIRVNLKIEVLRADEGETKANQKKATGNPSDVNETQKPVSEFQAFNKNILERNTIFSFYGCCRGTVGAAVVEWFDLLPSTEVNRVQSQAESFPDFHKWETCRTMPLVGGFSRGSPVSGLLHSHLISPSPALTTSVGPVRTQRNS